MSRWLGFRAERAAEKYLKQQGLFILHRNYAGKFGEIDLVAQDGGCIVFVEVRYRDEPETAIDSVDAKKQRRLQKTAQHYLASYDDTINYRFDIIAISRTKKVRWIKQAF